VAHRSNGLPESDPWQAIRPLTPLPVRAFLTSIQAVSGLPAVALHSFGFEALSVMKRRGRESVA
jgi:hypothetical protein